jgi:hypothetical protein
MWSELRHGIDVNFTRIGGVVYIFVIGCDIPCNRS